MHRSQHAYAWQGGTAMFVDAVGYSGNMERWPLETRRSLAVHFDDLKERVARHGGRVIDTAGDGLFAWFEVIGGAVRCARGFQAEVERRNARAELERGMRFRCGIALGETLMDDDRPSGQTVNVAARLMALAEPGAVNLDDNAYHAAIKAGCQEPYVDLGFRVLKGISAPVRLWRLLDGAGEARAPSDELAERYASALKPSRGIAVLPLEAPQTGRPDDDGAYLAMALATDLTDALAQSPWLKVISARSSMNYGENWNDARIARELGVRYLLRGRLRQRGKAVRIAARLLDTEDGSVVWAHTFDGSTADPFEMQDRIVARIVGHIEPVYLHNEQKRAATSVPRNVDAWDLLMRARWNFWRGTTKHVELARQCAQKALQLDPNVASTLALLSFCHMTDVWTGRSANMGGDAAAALDFARRAVRADDMDAHAHFTLGSALSMAGDLDGAIGAERRALELAPNFAPALGELARFLAAGDDPEGARRAALTALELSPADSHVSIWVRSLGLAAFVEGNYAEAARFAREAATKRPDWYFHFALLASAEALCGNEDAARRALFEGRRLLRNYPAAVIRTGHPFRDPAVFDTFLCGLRRAGWREPDTIADAPRPVEPPRTDTGPRPEPSGRWRPRLEEALAT